MSTTYVSYIFSPKMLPMKRMADIRHLIISTLSPDEFREEITDSDGPIRVLCPEGEKKDHYMSVLRELVGELECWRGSISLTPADKLLLITVNKKLYDNDKDIHGNWHDGAIRLYKMKVI